MPRKLKPYKVGTVGDTAFETNFDVFLDRTTKEFFCDVYGREFREESEREVKQAVRKYLRGRKFEWRQIIVVANRYQASYEMHIPTVSLRVERHEIAYVGRDEDALSDSGHWVERDFRDGERQADFIEDGRKRGVDIRRYHGPHKTDGTSTVLPYTDDTWANLTALQDAIRTLRDRIDAVIKEPGALAALVKTMPKQIKEG